MKYFLIVGEASGDLHASNLMKAIRKEDDGAQFHFYGGDLMSAVGGVRLKHYKDMAYMGFIPVLLHLRTILKNMHRCKQQILSWNPDVVILVDYPGFNLSIADYVRRKTSIPVFYYISPKIWAWKEHRIKQIRKNVDAMFSILPFEVDFYEKKHQYPICYVGNPTVDEVYQYTSRHAESFESFTKANKLDSRKPIIALLAGSRKQEIKDNLVIMCRAAQPFVEKGYQLVLAGAPSIEPSYYERLLAEGVGSKSLPVTILRGQTYALLQQAEVALVTSGTATLETALFRVPQVVCYYVSMGRLISFLRKHLLKVKYISLVNLIVNRKIVTELVADEMTVAALRSELLKIVKGGDGRQKMLEDYDDVIRTLGPIGASTRAAREMIRFLFEKKSSLK